MPPNRISFWADQLQVFAQDSHSIFGVIESSESRRVTLDVSYSSLEKLSLDQDELFRQALRCVESQLFRAAHVMSWAGFMDCLQSLAESDGFALLNSSRPNWKIDSREQLTETFTEHAQLEALHAMGVLRKAEKKSLLGMLSKRNECAHPGSYFPSYNESLGFISELFSRLTDIGERYPGMSLANEGAL